MDKKISELDQALQINNDAVFPISQNNGGTDTTYKVSITQISAEVGEDQTFSNLDTTDKTLVGAINEIAQGGGGTTDYEDLSNKPQVNSVELVGNKSLDDLGIMPASLSKTVSGSIAHFTDGADNIPVKSLVSQIVAVESGNGEKSPDNPYTISGFDSGVVSVCGKNFIDVNSGNIEQGTVDGGTGANSTANNRVRNINRIPFPFDELYSNYKLTIPSGWKLAMRFYKADGTFIVPNNAGFVFSLPSDVLGKGAVFVRWVFAKNDDSTITPSDIANLQYQLELGNTATPYEAYNGNTYTFDWSANLWDEQWELGLYSSSTGEPFSSSTYIRSKSTNYVRVSPNATIRATSPKTLRLCFYDNSYQYVSFIDALNENVTIPNNVYYIRFSVYDSSYGTTYNNDISINYSSVYGGHLNVTTGEVESELDLITYDGSENWQKNGEYFYIAVPSDNQVSFAVISNQYQGMPPTSYTVVPNGYMALSSAGYNYLNIHDNSYATLEDFKTALSNTNLQVLYKKVTPTTIQLTPTEVPTLLGENNIFSNCGDIEVNYYTDNADEIVEVTRHHYSTDEQVVGTWIDGSTIYEKTIYNAGGAYGEINIQHGVSNLERIVTAEGVCSDSGATPYNYYPFSRISGDGYNIGISVITTSIVGVYIPSAFQQRIVDIYVTIRYTKSST